MTLLFWLLVSYGLCFGLMNKATFLHNKLPILDKLLSCAYCTGFHTGWMVWLLAGVAGVHPVEQSAAQVVVGVVSWCFASSVFCYSTDTLIQSLERKH